MADPAHAMHQEALDAVTLLIQQGHKLHVVPQNFYEFWVVATRPASVNGLGKTAAEAHLDLTNLKGLFLWVDESPLVDGIWEGLVTGTPILGKNAHDVLPPLTPESQMMSSRGTKITVPNSLPGILVLQSNERTRKDGSVNSNCHLLLPLTVLAGVRRARYFGRA